MEQKPNRGLAWAGIALSGLYLLNPFAGVFELIPDFMPVIGNLDEVGAALLLAKCIQVLRRKGTGSTGNVPRLRPPEPPR
jgi:uncharacterized membrane protein YkvA (DUF1232 family)